MGAMASQITSIKIVYSPVYSGADQRNHQSSASLAFVRGIHRWPVNSSHKVPVTRKMFPFDDVIMETEQITKRKTCLSHIIYDLRYFRIEDRTLWDTSISCPKLQMSDSWLMMSARGQRYENKSLNENSTKQCCVCLTFAFTYNEVILIITPTMRLWKR